MVYFSNFGIWVKIRSLRTCPALFPLALIRFSSENVFIFDVYARAIDEKMGMIRSRKVGDLGLKGDSRQALNTSLQDKNSL